MILMLSTIHGITVLLGPLRPHPSVWEKIDLLSLHRGTNPSTTQPEAIPGPLHVVV